MHARIFFSGRARKGAILFVPFELCAWDCACGESDASRFIRMWKWPFDFAFVRVIFPVRHFYWLFVIVRKWYIQFVEQGKFPISFVIIYFWKKPLTVWTRFLPLGKGCNVEYCLSRKNCYLDNLFLEKAVRGMILIYPFREKMQCWTLFVWTKSYVANSLI
jgi:hypothetical protein